MESPTALGKDVLIVDDDDAVRTMLSRMLEAEGYSVVGAANGREALNYLYRNAQPQLILLDLTMPVMNGWEFRRWQKRDERLASIPVVVCSAAENVREETTLVEAAEYLQKPIEPAALLEIIRHYCH